MIYQLQHLLTNTAKKYPEKDAVVFGDDSITYGELDKLTNKLANALKENGVQRGDRVGIYVHKSIPSIINIYSILKAGATYVPLDPNAPNQRIAYIIDNCNIRCLLTSTTKAASLKGLLEEAKSLEVAILTDNSREFAEELPIKLIQWEEITSRMDDQLPENKGINTDLAYILYTSGSTGTPKGVMISHLNSLTFVNWVEATLDVSSEDRFSSHAPLHFDLSILDIYVSCKVGATLCLVPETMSMFPIRLAGWIAKNKISVWYSVPSILSMMVLHGKLEEQDFSDMRYLIFAGEVFPVKFLRQLMDFIPNAEYYNLYGPTETNVITYYKTPKLDPERTKPIPIGKCCENMEVFALDKEDNVITEVGVEGELVARGTMVAQGYWGDEEKTKKGFVNNHTQSHFSERIYRTGDLVILDESGDYIYVGRKDHMIKSRGYRIEIGDIEAAIYSHDGIKEAAVIPIPDDLIGNRIKAFIALREGVEMTAADLRIFCSEKLQKYMVPELVEFREELPKTSTGKIDKTTLAKGEQT